MRIPSIDYYTARLYQAQAKWNEACEYYSEEDLAFCAHANYARAFVFDMYAKKKEALTYVNRAIELRHDWPEAYYLKATILEYIYVHHKQDQVVLEEAWQSYKRAWNYGFKDKDCLLYVMAELSKKLARKKLALFLLRKVRDPNLARIAKLDISELEEATSPPELQYPVESLSQ